MNNELNKFKTMEELLVKLETWLLENRPNYFKELNPPATDDELNKLEQHLGAIKLLTEYKDCYPEGLESAIKIQ